MDFSFRIVHPNCEIVVQMSLPKLQNWAFKQAIYKKACTRASAHHISSPSFFSSRSSSSSSSSSSASSFFLASSSLALASSSSFFLALSTSDRAFHFLANSSASARSSVMMTLSKIAPPFTCQRSKPMKPKSAYSETPSSSLYSGLSISLAVQTPLYAGLEIRLTNHSPLKSGLSFIGGSHSPSSSSSQTRPQHAQDSQTCRTVM